MKLRTKILSYTLPLILIPFLLMAVAVYYFVIRANQVQIQEEKSQRLSEAIVGFGQEIDSAKKDIQMLSSVPIISNHLQNKSANIDQAKEDLQAKTILELFFKQNPYYSKLSLVDKKGNELIKFSKLPKDQELKSVKNEDYFRRTLIVGAAQFPVQEVQENKFTTTFTQVIAKDEFIGLLVLTLNTDVFERSMRPLVKSGLNTFLFDDRGVVLADSFNSDDNRNLLNDIDFQKNANDLLTDISLETSEIEIVNGKKKYLLSFLPSESFTVASTLERQQGSNWFLGVLEPKTSTPIPFGFQVVFFSILFVAIGAVLYLTAKASRYITIPLEQVSTATSKIARGDSDLDLNIKTGDEVEDLANAVRRMNFELKDYQKQIVQSAKLATMGEMTSEISHEIQNRISGISLWLQHLDSEIENDDPRQEYLNEMKQGLDGFMGMLANLKVYYKTPVLDLKEVDLNLLIKDSMVFIEEKAKEKSIEIVTFYQADLPKTMGDEEKLKSVILNLLLNAIESIGEKGKVEINTGFDNELFVSISDNGDGIAEEDLSRIFYPFYSNKSGGSGLGLAISSNIISAHKGRIDVQSEVGIGTTFKVLFSLPQNNH